MRKYEYGLPFLYYAPNLTTPTRALTRRLHHPKVCVLCLCTLVWPYFLNYGCDNSLKQFFSRPCSCCTMVSLWKMACERLGWYNYYDMGFRSVSTSPCYIHRFLIIPSIEMVGERSGAQKKPMLKAGRPWSVCRDMILVRWVDLSKLWTSLTTLNRCHRPCIRARRPLSC